MKYEDILKDLKNKIYHPVYLLHGEEPYFIDKISDYIEAHLLTDAEKSFNQTILYGKDTDHLALLDTLRRYPMMSNYQVVILKEAQQFKNLDKLTEYFEKPLKSTVFVICHKYKKLDGRTALYKLLSSKSVTFLSNKFWDNQIPAFVTSIAKRHQHQISQRASALLTEYLGNDLSKIENEVEKLALNVPKETPIDVAHIEKYIGISKDYNVFELTKSLINRDTKGAFRIVNYFIKNPKPNPPIKVIGALYSFFSRAFVYQSAGSAGEKALKIHPAAIRDLSIYQRNYSIKDTVHILDVLSEYDLKSKGVQSTGSDKGGLMTEMVYKILN